MEGGLGTKFDVLEANTQLSKDKQLLAAKIGDKNMNEIRTWTKKTTVAYVEYVDIILTLNVKIQNVNAVILSTTNLNLLVKLLKFIIPYNTDKFYHL